MREYTSMHESLAPLIRPTWFVKNSFSLGDGPCDKFGTKESATRKPLKPGATYVISYLATTEQRTGVLVTMVINGHHSNVMQTLLRWPLQLKHSVHSTNGLNYAQDGFMCTDSRHSICSVSSWLCLVGLFVRLAVTQHIAPRLWRCGVPGWQTWAEGMAPITASLRGVAFAPGVRTASNREEPPPAPGPPR